MFLLQGAVTIEGSNVFVDTGNDDSIRDREKNLKLMIGTGSLFLSRNTVSSSGSKESNGIIWVD